MATKKSGFAYLLLFLTISTASCTLSDIFDEVASCKEVCRNTYTPHTYEKSSSEECCNRGCRLFSMIEFIYDDVNRTTAVCLESCEEAYEEKDESEACSLGCKNQKPFSIDSLLKGDPWGQNMQLVDPFAYMHSWCNSMFNHVISQASVSWTMYVKDGDGSVLIVKSPPKYKVIDFVDAGFSEDSDEYNTASYIETNIEPVDNSATPFLKNSAYKAHRNDDDLIDLSARDTEYSPGPHDDHTDWLSCIAKKTGLPRLLLSWLLLMCAVVMIWLCLSAAVTSPEQKVYTEPKKLSINGDQEVMEELLAKGIKPTYSKAKPELAALPIKISVHRI